MTKNQWIVEWRERRIKERIFWLNQPINPTSNLNAILRELYDCIYLPKQQTTITLVSRYKEKLTGEYLKRHQDLIDEWKPAAKIRASELLQSLVYGRNPFLEMCKSGQEFSGKHFPVPIKYED